MTDRCVRLSMLLTAIAGLWGCGGEPPPPPHDSTAMLSDSTPFMTPGIDRPHAIPAAEADIDDDAEVIGIAVEGQSRAYLVKAMSGMTTHIANDIVGDVPVSVTYCDRTDFARAFTSPRRGAVVDLEQQGWVDGELSLMFKNKGFRHSSQDIPLEDYPHERMTWGEWKQLYPETTLVATLRPQAHPSTQPPAAQQPTPPVGDDSQAGPDEAINQ
jgi:hypothetical protein